MVSNLVSKFSTSANNCSPATLQLVTKIAPSLVATEASDNEPANNDKAPNKSNNSSYVFPPNNIGSVGYVPSLFVPKAIEGAFI